MGEMREENEARVVLNIVVREEAYPFIPGTLYADDEIIR